MGYDVFFNTSSGRKIIVGWHRFRWQAKRDIKHRPKALQDKYTIERVSES